ncbi:MAG TPA: hypothetical protein VFX59_18555 [Polyangiales bacterium]|nr:hypothetical protein [Polyangiales bacterium]
MKRFRLLVALFALQASVVRADPPVPVDAGLLPVPKASPDEPPQRRETEPSSPPKVQKKPKGRPHPTRLPPPNRPVRDERDEADEEDEDKLENLLDPLPNVDPAPELSPLPELEPAVSQFIETLPQSVQDTAASVASSMTKSRRPPERFLRSIFGLPRGRFGTGTAWLPDESPLLASVPHFGNWGLLLHGTVYAGYDYYSSKRGGRRFFGRNTLMGSLFRTFEHSEWLFRAALSLEPLTIGTRGYPQVLQSGQQADGDRVHDQMYALDFFRELAATYSWEVTRNWAAMFYAALAGDPAVGPVTFTQRISASPDPLAPLGFVAQENSHTSFGVLTVGAFTRTMKFEASWFNGSLPGDHKFTIAIRRPDSYAVRASWNPFSWLSTQVSYAFLGSPSRHDPGRSDHRFTSSATYTRWRPNDSGLAATLSFAEHVSNRNDLNTSLMAETYWNIDGHNAVYGRLDLLQKSGAELVLPEPTTELFAIGAVGAGYIYYFSPLITLTPGLGVRGSVNLMEDDLARFYGGQAAYGVMAYMQLRTTALPLGGT